MTGAAVFTFPVRSGICYKDNTFIFNPANLGALMRIRRIICETTFYDE